MGMAWVSAEQNRSEVPKTEKKEGGHISATFLFTKSKKKTKF